jgi:hypothetical protein
MGNTGEVMKRLLLVVLSTLFLSLSAWAQAGDAPKTESSHTTTTRTQRAHYRTAAHHRSHRHHAKRHRHHGSV